MKQSHAMHERGSTAECASALVALSLTLLSCDSTRADEGGVSFWLSGQYSSFAAVPQQPGWYTPPQLYYYNGSADATKNFQRGDSANLGLSSQATLIFFTPTWVPNEKWFGGQPSFSLAFGGGWNSTSADLSASLVKLGTQTLNRSDTDSGGADLYPQAQIPWTSDSGSGDHVGSFKSQVAAVGPEVGYSFTVGGQSWYANLRAYKECWAENRLEGYAVFATLSIPLGRWSEEVIEGRSDASTRPALVG